MAIFSLLSGYKTYIAGVGLFGLAIYQASQGEYQAAIQSATGGLAAVGLRHAVSKSGS